MSDGKVVFGGQGAIRPVRDAASIFGPAAAPIPVETVLNIPVPSAPSVPSVPAVTYRTRPMVDDRNNMVTLKQAADNGAGTFAGHPGATVNYSTGAVRIKPTEIYTYLGYTTATVSGNGTWNQLLASDAWGDGSLVRIWFRPASVSPTDQSESMAAQHVQIMLAPFTGDSVVPGSVQFKLGASTYIDRDGKIYRNIQPNGSGTLSGNINYSSGRVTLTDWDAGSAVFELQSLLTFRGQWDETDFLFYTEQAPILPSSMYVSAVAVDTGDLLTGNANADGDIVGDYVAGTIDSETGLAHVRFGAVVADASLTEADKAAPWYDPAAVDGDGNIWRPRAVIPPTARYGCVVLTFVPVDPEMLGLDTVRLPPNGRVPQFRAGDYMLLMHGASTTGVPVLDVDSGLFALDLGRERVAWVTVRDADGDRVTDGHTLDRAAGVLRFDAIAALVLPLTVRHTIADLVIGREVQITGRIATNLPLTHDYPAHDTLVASCLPVGDRRARVSMSWDQQTWDQSWVDHVVGNEALGNLNLVAHPIVVTNLGTITERWAVLWGNGGNVTVYGQERGVVYTGPFTADIAPLNPNARDEHGALVPYFRLPAAANAGGFGAGNVFRFNTVAAQFGFWVSAAMQQSLVPLGDAIDSCEIRVIANVNNPVGE